MLFLIAILWRKSARLRAYLRNPFNPFESAVREPFNPFESAVYFSFTSFSWSAADFLVGRLTPIISFGPSQVVKSLT